jgi:hypothetical protein
LLCSDLELGKKILPMLGLDRVISQVSKRIIDLLVVLELSHVCLVHLVSSHAVWKLLHFIHLGVKGVFHRSVNIDLEWSLVNLINHFPNVGHGGPYLEQVGLVFLKIVELVWISKLHIEKLLGFADTCKLSLGCLDLLSQYGELIGCFLDGAAGLFRPS